MTSRQQFVAVFTAAIMVVSMVAVGGLASISVFSSAEHPDALSDGVAEASHTIPSENNLDSDEYLVDDDFEPGEVADDDQLYPNISAAVSNANAGYTIYVREGTYPETVDVDKRLHLIGAGMDQVAVTGSSVVMNITADNVMVHGFTFDGDAGDNVVQVLATSPSNDVKDLTFTENRVITNEGAVGLYHAPMEQGTNHDQTVIHDNVFTVTAPGSQDNPTNADHHIDIDATPDEIPHNITISNNTFTTPLHKGEHVGQINRAVVLTANDSKVTHNEFDARANPDFFESAQLWVGSESGDEIATSGNLVKRNNIDANWASYGIAANFEGGEDLTIFNNVVENAQEYGVVVARYDGVVIERNDIMNNHGPGMIIFASTNVEVLDNDIDSNVNIGLHMLSVDNATVHENDLQNTAGSIGLLLQDVSDTSVTYNLIEDNDEGIKTLGDTFNVEIRKNEFVDNAKVGLNATEWSYNVVANYNDFSNQAHDVRNDEPMALDATLNWFGTDDTDIAEMANVTGNVIYDPFLTQAPWDVKQQAHKTEAYAHDFTLKESTGPVHVIASPGPGDRTVGEAFEDLPAGTQLWAYDSEDDEWTMPEPDDSIDPLDAFVVTGLDDTRDATVVFGYAGDGAAAPHNSDLYGGWNLVGAPEKNDAEEGFMSTTATHTLVGHFFEGPKSQPRFTNGVSAAGTPRSWTHTVGTEPDECVSPYTGYWVYVDDDDTGGLPAQLSDGVSAQDEVEILQTDVSCEEHLYDGT